MRTNQPNTPRVLALYATAGGLTAAILFAAGAAIHAAVTDDPDPAACKQAMRRQLAEGIRDPGATGSRPPECDGLDDATLERLAGEVLREVVGDSVEDKLGGG